MLGEDILQGERDNQIFAFSNYIEENCLIEINRSYKQKNKTKKRRKSPDLPFETNLNYRNSYMLL